MHIHTYTQASQSKQIFFFFFKNITHSTENLLQYLTVYLPLTWPQKASPRAKAASGKEKAPGRHTGRELRRNQPQDGSGRISSSDQHRMWAHRAKTWSWSIRTKQAPSYMRQLSHTHTHTHTCMYSYTTAASAYECV